MLYALYGRNEAKSVNKYWRDNMLSKAVLKSMRQAYVNRAASYGMKWRFELNAWYRLATRRVARLLLLSTISPISSLWREGQRQPSRIVGAEKHHRATRRARETRARPTASAK